MYAHVAVSELITLIYIPCYLSLPYHPPPLPPQVEAYHRPSSHLHTHGTINSASNSVQLENNGASKSVHNQVQLPPIPIHGRGRAGSRGVNLPDSYLRYPSDDVPMSHPANSDDAKLYNYFKNVYKSKEIVRKPGTSTSIESQSSSESHVESDNTFSSTTSTDRTHTGVQEAAHAESNSNPHLTPGVSETGNFPSEDLVSGKPYKDGNHPGVDVRLLDGTQLAMQEDEGGGEHSKVSDLVLSVGTSLAALFTLGLVLGIFSCCCRRGKTGGATHNGQDKARVLPQVDSAAIINQSELPNAEEDQDEPLSVKAKIRALDKQLILQPSPNHRPPRKKSQETSSETSGQSQPPQIVISDKDDVARRSSSNMESRETVSPSDTQDDVSEITMDNDSMHSSMVSQPHNPDVVIADEGEPDEFADIQRGTSILKSYQRVKPPRNRSPATRHSKGRIRKSRPVLDPKANKDNTVNEKPDDSRKPLHSPAGTRAPHKSPADTRTPNKSPADTRTPNKSPTDTRTPNKSPADTRTPNKSPTDTRKAPNSPAGIKKPVNKLDDSRKSQYEPIHARKTELLDTPRRKPIETNEKVKFRPSEPSRRSRPLSASIPVIFGSLADRVKTRSHENLCDKPNDTKSIFSDLKDLNAIKDKLATIQSQQDKQPELPSKYKKPSDTPDNKPSVKASEVPSLYKSKESQKGDGSNNDKGQDLPSLYQKSVESPKHKHSENEADRRLDSPTRYKKHKGSPAVNKKKLRKHEGESSSLPRTDTRDDDRGDDSTDPNDAARSRLSAIPAGAQNNIFYLIDPTVKNKCQSAGELVARQNAQHKQKSEETSGSKHRLTVKDSETPVSRERTLSDPSRNSQLVEQTNL